MVRHLMNTVSRFVENGVLPVNIQDEVRKHKDPTIVFDLQALFVPVGEQDTRGLFCGGRFNVAYAMMDEFFGKLTGLGTKLVFFYNGPVQGGKSDTWLARQDVRYEKTIRLIDDVDRGMEMEGLAACHEAPYNFRYPLKHLARKHGCLKLSQVKDCDQELAAYACKVQALAVVSADSDFLIYEGDWHLWSSKDLDFKHLTTKELNREALRGYLHLSQAQMPLLATLAGNDIVAYDEVKGFHSYLGRVGRKFQNIARFIRNQPEVLSVDDRFMERVFGRSAQTPGLKERFMASLDFYRTNVPAPELNPTNDPIQAILLAQDSPILYQLWHGVPVDVAINIVDMRGNDFGSRFGELIVAVIRRMAGIVRFHRQNEDESIGFDCSQVKVLIKMQHETNHGCLAFPVEFPEFAEPPPPLDELMSKDPEVHANLLDVKFQLCGWLISDKLDHTLLKSVKEELLVTVLTLCYLVEMQVLNLNEADLFLQIAYDVAFETYDMYALSYPSKLEGRSFRLAFLYQRVYVLMAKAVRLVGLANDGAWDDPLFDGVLFHNRYSSWISGEGELKDVDEWRIYKDLCLAKTSNDE